MHKILIAEDDNVSAKILAEAVEEMGFVAFISPNGKHASEALKANKDFKILITDIKMPEMDGYQLIQNIRGSSDFKTIPIIIMSAVAKKDDIQHLLKLGPTSFHPKPFSAEELQKDITKFLNIQK